MQQQQFSHIRGKLLLLRLQRDVRMLNLKPERTLNKQRLSAEVFEHFVLFLVLKCFLS